MRSKNALPLSPGTCRLRTCRRATATDSVGDEQPAMNGIFMMNTKSIRKTILTSILLVVCATASVAQRPRSGMPPPTPTPLPTPVAATEPAVPPASNAPQRITREGINIEFKIEPGTRGEELQEGKEAVVTFSVKDTTTGQPVGKLRPAAWIDERARGTTSTDAKACREKVQSFLTAQLSQRPAIDLNSYYVLALNDEPNISVIDPLLGFGTTKLLTVVFLKSPGEDWVMSADRRRLYVSMPLVNQVAVVDTSTWKVTENLDTGAKPVRLRLQADGRYLWVGTDGLNETAPGGVTVIDTTTQKVVAQITTGAGHHEIAFSSDDRFAYVTNRTDGTLSVVEVARLAKVKDLKTGAHPSSLAYSPLGRAVYVAHEREGRIAVVDPASHTIAAGIETKPGVATLRFAPDGRHGFAVNPKENVVHIFDASTNRLLHNVSVADAPDQVTFTKQFAYVRALGNEHVSMINLSQLGAGTIESSVSRFPGGQKAPGLSASRSAADVVVPSAEQNAVLVANPADKMIYYYQEGMAAPMGSFTNYKREPRALMVWDASLREIAPGVYSTKTQLTARGNYDVAFLLDSPRIINCFEMSIKENPAFQKKREVAIRVEPLLKEPNLRAGESVQLRFKVTDTQTKQPRADLKDMGVLTFLAPGIWQQRHWAKSVGEGVYEINFVPPQSGVYYIFFQCPSLGVAYRQIPHLILNAEAATTKATATKGGR
ncbi:MAG TPA: cytochrome D1 domain-containing protein [Pyrinomonadaceae bacterium]|nr:cytochrome D1 domain-containing protein [Pyrinomonadaceae bacterium]